MTAIRASKKNRDESMASTTLRSYAEYLQNTVANGSYSVGATTGTAAYQYPGSLLPAGFSASLTGVNCWKPGTASTPGSWKLCSRTPDVGVQQLTIKVASADNLSSENLSVVVRKPCSVGTSTAC